ncbi:T9SS type A sorting domain-containing protein [Roseivirga thermotolerans]|uniref:T9SS type A sorting domain-containing protein n=1 Tax=Roseivirga thermotolerans TaxID=1758176 RepID=UPI00273F4544|nr:T9SS type A sorting domain-containing protein [Roseivirga thermotolerans]
MKYLIVLITLFFATTAKAQVAFTFDQTVELRQDNERLARAFEGGLNSAQFQTMDLNMDGQQDLVIFHRQSGHLTTYIRQDDEWVFDPSYAFQFPADVVNWMVLTDFDCDGKKDLFTNTTLGIKVYRNMSTSEGVAWQLASEFLRFDQGSNLQVSATDIPGFADVNGDGALDILSYRFGSSGSIEYYQNTGSCGSLNFTRITRNWGDFYDCGCNNFSFGQPCQENSGEAAEEAETSEPAVILHAGGKTILPFDADNDGDIDIVASDELCTNLVFFENKGTTQQASITDFHPFPSQDPVAFEFFPSAFLLDTDFDQVMELVVSTNIDRNLGNRVNFTNHIQVFDNSGNNLNPTFEGKQPFLQHEMVDLGEDAYPAFWDYDADGDLDLFVGHAGQPTPNGLVSSLWLFENTGNRFNPSFALATTDFQNLSSLGYAGFKPQMADIDNDGITDIVLQAQTGGNSAAIFLLKGLGDGRFETPVNLNLPTTPNNNPLVYDIDGNGLADVLLGGAFGGLTAFINEGNLRFREEEQFGGFENDFTRQVLSVAVANWSGTSKPQLLTIDSQGALTLYEAPFNAAFQKGPSVTTLISEGNNLRPSRLGRSNYLAAADLFGNGKPSLVVGTKRGGLLLLRNVGTGNGGSENDLRVSLSPNPSADSVRLLVNANAMVSVVDTSGRLISEPVAVADAEVTTLDFSSYPVGLYLIRIVSSDGRSITKKLLIQR